MNEEIIRNGKRAYISYMNKEEGIEEKILEYFNSRVKANHDSIENLLRVTNENLDIEKIDRLFQKSSKYKGNKKLRIDLNDFIDATLVTSKGIILKEESEVEKVIEIYIDVLLSRNAVVIADIDYSEISVKKLILDILNEALRKYEIEGELIQLLPYEEINEEEFPKYVENKKRYVYLEDSDFEEESIYERDVLHGEIDDVIEKINSGGVCECAVIYTKDREKAYQFMNRVTGKNIFVNAGYDNICDVKVEEYYIHKHILYPTK